MPDTLNLFAGRRSDSSRVDEEVLVRSLGGRRFELLKSPGIVLGLAAGDVFELNDNDEFVVVTRGRNLCVQLFFMTEPEALAQEATHRLEPLGGRLDGRAVRQLVYTVPVAAGFESIEGALRALVTRFPQVTWYFGNVYDPKDGVTPLNWW
jgi:hypothetical protein